MFFGKADWPRSEGRPSRASRNQIFKISNHLGAGHRTGGISLVSRDSTPLATTAAALEKKHGAYSCEIWGQGQGLVVLGVLAGEQMW
eukprot:2210577-Prymnesium_polylepis.1